MLRVGFCYLCEIEWNDAGTIFFDLYHEYVFSETLLMTHCLHIHAHINAISLIMCEKSLSVKFETMLSIKGNDV